MRTTIALTQSYSDFGHSSLSISVKQLCTMQNHCVIFLTGSGQETGNINQTYNWNIKCIAETNKTSTLTTCVSIKYTCVSRRLIRDRKSTRLNSSHANISYAVFCLKKKITKHT